MPFKIETKLNSKLFDKANRTQPFANLISKNAREFRQSTKQKMVNDSKSGRLYQKRRGANFRRAHRASARGERPAPDTQTLLNSISDRSVSDLSSEVYIADKVNPDSGTVTTKYGPILQEKLGRPIMVDEDVQEAQTKMNADGERLIQTLI